MGLYLQSTQTLMQKFKEIRPEQIPRGKNENVDALVKLGSQKEATYLGVIPLEIQEEPSVPSIEVMEIEATMIITWMTSILAYLKEGVLPTDKVEARRLRYKAYGYTIYDVVLYKKGFNQSLLVL